MTASKQGNYEIRTMQRPELDFAVELAAQEGWNPGIHDADCFYNVDPNGFLIGLLDGEPISCISVVKYPDNYAFLGFYIVKEGYRGQGYGYRIWQAGMDYLADCDVGLDGVAAQVANYAKSGFAFAYYNARYQGAALGGGKTEQSNIIELANISFADLNTYDQSVFGSLRPNFLKLWISRPETIALGVQEDSKLAGYGVLRKCREGYKVGPLFADNSEYAQMLFSELSRRIPKDTAIFLDIPPPAINPQASALVEAHGMVKVFETARMYRMAKSETQLNLSLHKWFGVTSFELG